jgi:hypothetical protein
VVAGKDGENAVETGKFVDEESKRYEFGRCAQRYKVEEGLYSVNAGGAGGAWMSYLGSRKAQDGRHVGRVSEHVLVVCYMC